MLLQSQTAALQEFELPVVMPYQKQRHPALEQLICAALCDDRLADMLVHSPSQALKNYELVRRLSTPEQRIVLSITGASDIYDYAGRLHAMLNRARRPAGRLMHDDPAFDRQAALDRDAQSAHEITTLHS